MFLGALPEAISGLGDPWRFPLWAEIRSPYAPELAVNSATLPETATHVRYCSRGSWRTCLPVSPLVDHRFLKATDHKPTKPPALISRAS